MAPGIVDAGSVFKRKSQPVRAESSRACPGRALHKGNVRFATGLFSFHAVIDTEIATHKRELMTENLSLMARSRINMPASAAAAEYDAHLYLLRGVATTGSVN